MNGQGKGKDTAPGQNKEAGDSTLGNAVGKEAAPGQNKSNIVNQDALGGKGKGEGLGK